MKQHTILHRMPAVLPFVFALIFASCDNPVTPPSNGEDAAPIAVEKANVSFSIAGMAARDGRTILPDLSEIDLNDLRYTLTGTKGAVITPLGTVSAAGTTLTLDPGQWQFTLTAVTADDDIILTAAAEATLAADTSNEVMFTLTPLAEGTGAVHISFTYPAQVGISSVRTGGQIAEETISLPPEDGAWAYQAANVAAGDYLATFTFYRGTEAAAAVTETVQVRAGLTSKQTLPLTVTNLKGYIRPEGATVAAQLQWIQDNAVSNANYLVTAAASETIAPTTLKYTDKTGVTITLAGSGTERTISLSEKGSMFTVEQNVTLILESNITLAGRSDNTASLVNVREDGTLVMNDGAKISGNTATNDRGGGVYIYDGDFTMNGGEISGNTVTGSSVFGGDGGGGVFVTWSDFTMHGGVISRNTATNSVGGGVYVDGYSTFIMNGGEISENTATVGGGGVSLENDGSFVTHTFTMNGGKISGNKSGSGGGVSVNYDMNFTMTGGEISGNTATRNGGGVFFAPERYQAAFSKTGGIIYGNTAGAPLANNAAAGHAVYWYGLPHYRNSTLGVNDNINTGNTSGWEYGTPTVTALVNTWTPGDIKTGGVAGAQWFSFTAGTANQFIHIKRGTLGGYYTVAVFDSEWLPVVIKSSAGNGTNAYDHLSGLSVNQTYYIKVFAWGNSDAGTYEIMVKDSPLPEETTPAPLATGWNTSNIAVIGVQWFSFTATATEQYIHANFGGDMRLAIAVFDNAWQSVFDEDVIYGDIGYMESLRLSDLTANQTYYIKVRRVVTGYFDDTSFDYGLWVNDIPIPASTSTALAAGWNAATLAAGNAQWFTFTASAANQYIHAQFGTLQDMYVNVYDSTWQSLGYSSRLYGATKYKFLSGLTVGQTYNIKVWPNAGGNSGDYKIAVNTAATPPADS